MHMHIYIYIHMIFDYIQPQHGFDKGACVIPSRSPPESKDSKVCRSRSMSESSMTSALDPEHPWQNLRSVREMQGMRNGMTPKNHPNWCFPLRDQSLGSFLSLQNSKRSQEVWQSHWRSRYFSPRNDEGLAAAQTAMPRGDLSPRPSWFQGFFDL